MGLRGSAAVLSKWLDQCRQNRLTMFAWVLLVLPLLAVDASWHKEGCVLPPASTESFFFTNAPKTWNVQYMYPVPGVYDLGCGTRFQYPGEKPNQINFIGNFSRVPQFPMKGMGLGYGNRINVRYYGIWDCMWSGPVNIVYSHQEFLIGHSCILGHDFAEIHTTAKEPSEELMHLIWKIVANHTELDIHKFKKAIC